MRCTSPRTVGFRADGKTLAWSQKHYCKEFASFQLPCGKCKECRLEYSRQWAIRCVHEAQMHPKNCFITLTYDADHLESNRLKYEDFQLFVKRLRSHILRSYLKKNPEVSWKELPLSSRKEIMRGLEISLFITGEYGEKNKRPHWHALIFNWEPHDKTYSYSNSRGDKNYTSEKLTELWGKGKAEFGDVTFHSAGYVARYAAKKLVHGNDGHEYEPISKKSSKQAIGKRWLEKFWWTDCFANGEVGVMTEKGRQVCPIPRYYEKWLQKNHPREWVDYVTKTKLKKQEHASARAEKEKKDYEKNLRERGLRKRPLTRNEKRKVISDQKFKLLQEKLKL